MADTKKAQKNTSTFKEVKKSEGLRSSVAKFKANSPVAAHGVGRRKKAVARIWLKSGSGQVIINGRALQNYFDTTVTQQRVLTPFKVISSDSQYDVQANVYGGGLWGQADAVKLGIARALVATDETLKPTLRQHGLLTVDDRNKERKKYGQRAARRKFQFVKR